MNYKKSGQLFSKEDANSFKSLKNEADLSPRKRTLKKLHTSHDEELHTMINVLKKGTYIRPHKHSIKTHWGEIIKKGESFLALEGEGKIILFDDDGSITETIPMKDTEKSMVWIPANVYHTIVALSDYFIIFENKTGPWKENEDKFFHINFPDENDINEHIVEEWRKMKII
jgi:cupin fold WbuC family metalloprotein